MYAIVRVVKMLAWITAEKMSKYSEVIAGMSIANVERIGMAGNFRFLEEGSSAPS